VITIVVGADVSTDDVVSAAVATPIAPPEAPPTCEFVAFLLQMRVM
jgi:hypothetical protein